MKSVLTAFSLPAPLWARRAAIMQNRGLTRSRPTQYHNSTTPKMLTAASVATELLAVAVLGYGSYYLIFREKVPAETTEEEQQSSTSRQGIIGLSGSVGHTSAATTFPVAAASPPTPPLFDTVGVDINDYLDSGDGPLTDKQSRLGEELCFAADSLSDLSGCDAILVIDAAGDVVWVDGDLVGDTAELGKLPRRVSETGKPETLNVTGNEILPFLKDDVRNIALLPIGTQGAVLVVASRQNGFFDEVEKRVANAVCGRLAGFLFVPPAPEA